MKTTQKRRQSIEFNEFEDRALDVVRFASAIACGVFLAMILWGAW
jgi:hypothetical protein